MRKKLPIGVSDFKILIEEDYAYVDKSLFIQELVEGGVNKVSLIPRMRRFGKTLNLSMLRYFFEKTDRDTHHLFSRLKIWAIEKYRAMQGQYPVIFFSLKDIKHTSWSSTLRDFQLLVAKEFNRHLYLVEGELLSAKEKGDFHALLHTQADQPLLEKSLLFLSEWLHRSSGKRVVLLIDEYDTPAHAAYINEYYNDCILFLRNWLSCALKDNTFLEFGVLTGILRIAKESIFSGLNNIETFSVLSEAFQDKFGFLESEVQTLLKEYDLEGKLHDMRAWYNGYRIGNESSLYNPWSVLACIKGKGTLAPYWVNTSDNALLMRLLTEGSDELKSELEELLSGKSIEKIIIDGIVFENLENNPNMIWSLLAYSGYLTLAQPAVYGAPVRLKIPNSEVRELYRSMILGWFSQSITETKYQLLLKSLVTGDMDTFSELFEKFVLATFSMFDVTQKEPEKVYHAFVLGMLIGLADTYEVRSNRESGLGRYDVILFPKKPDDLGIVIEFKKVRPSEKMNLEETAQSALKQIEEKKYATELHERGVKRILALGIAFEGKNIFVRSLML